MNPVRLSMVFVACASVAALAAMTIIPNLKHFEDPSGQFATFNRAGAIDENNAFFQSLGTNGRSCATCHSPDQAFTFSAANAQTRFEATSGTDPLFAAVDGANCPTAVVGDRSSHSLVLNNGLIRVFLPIPPEAEFTISVQSDPYGCAMGTDPKTGQTTVSVYRRPLPATNLGFLSAVMWDGREVLQPLTSAATFQSNLISDLKHQALDATLGHAQASMSPSDTQLSSIVSFELGLSTSQAGNNKAGDLEVAGAEGGPVRLSQQRYYPGINDSLGADPTGAPFSSAAFSLFRRWAESPDEARAAIAAGEKIFNTSPLTITAVRGLNDNPALGTGLPIQGTCTTCHDAPNVGNHSFPLALDIGTSHAPGLEQDPVISGSLNKLSTPNLPIFRISGCKGPAGDSVDYYTSDPGRALISGKCVDVNRIKGPILRGLAARAPYFHNGSAASLDEVVEFYNDRFKMGLTEEEKQQLVAFLNAL